MFHGGPLLTAKTASAMADDEVHVLLCFLDGDPAGVIEVAVPKNSSTPHCKKLIRGEGKNDALRNVDATDLVRVHSQLVLFDPVKKDTKEQNPTQQEFQYLNSTAVIAKFKL